MKAIVSFRNLVLTTTFGAMMVCCSEKEKAPDFNRSGMLENIGRNVILPNYINFEKKSDSLSIVADQFYVDPSLENLVLLQNQFKRTLGAWQSVEIFNFGPADSAELAVNVNSWPTNTKKIDFELQSTEEINDNYVFNLGTTSKGLSAVEYLIFSHSLSQNDVLSTFAIERRRRYLKALCKNIKSISSSVATRWRNGYLTQFIASSGTSSSSSSSMVINQMVFFLEVIIKQKLGNPMGKKSSQDTSINIKPMMIENHLSDATILNLTTNINIIEQVFTGREGVGLDDYVRELGLKSKSGKPLEEAIIGQFQVIRSQINLISTPMYATINIDYKSVQSTWIECRRLLVFMKTDMMSGLGFVPTFSDNDGD